MADDYHQVTTRAVRHGFDDADCVRALGQVRLAMGQTGATAVVMELVLQAAPA